MTIRTHQYRVQALVKSNTVCRQVSQTLNISSDVSWSQPAAVRVLKYRVQILVAPPRPRSHTMSLTTYRASKRYPLA